MRVFSSGKGQAVLFLITHSYFAAYESTKSMLHVIVCYSYFSGLYCWYNLSLLRSAVCKPSRFAEVRFAEFQWAPCGRSEITSALVLPQLSTRDLQNLKRMRSSSGWTHSWCLLLGSYHKGEMYMFKYIITVLLKIGPANRVFKIISYLHIFCYKCNKEKYSPTALGVIDCIALARSL